MNAIILAAGLGSRFKELTENNHKALFNIKGKPNLERTIEYLHQAKIYDITIVTGHNSHLLSYLTDKYQVKLVYNEKYAEYNNIYSFFKAIDNFHHSYVIDADVVLFKNIFLPQNDYSSYFLIQREKTHNEWIPQVNSQGFVEEIMVSSENRPSLLGVSYWKPVESGKIKKALNNFMMPDLLSNPKLYWDDIPRGLLENLQVKTILLDQNDAGEMDNLEDYLSLQK
ncbi:CTP--phosphocholine cytidylyltransferase [Mergibacter septicus]|uniref:CTP--phosphocholine cytidylyltransferase n=1 Tax=Mergibacter septicus TaxID=221402 RepID=A0A8E3MG00_9PAST|nr:NTP transferase domain-containing protein [Mergibacter septicus]AWX15318.1 CTP--phosphocholine cytidylyltransferase [Mergibacter septicus]QDJ14572.1 CTP--phosphocholine cytidylyltransferase [Mergibacter septicus]UTU47994.1 NTP transferase domain-containing protein [Mergibacter septicus]WMR96398.1 NTP transferase domain-containing protein [Mergibacter septicus]